MSELQDPRLPPDMRLGDLLREAREERGLELSDVAGLTSVRKDYLIALEEGRYSDLPEDVYTKNFLRLFAQAVGFDVVRAQELYRSERRNAKGFDTVEQKLERDRELAADVPPLGDGGRWWETPRSGPRWGPLVSTVVMVAAVVALALWGFNSTFFNTRGNNAGTPAGSAATADVENGPAARGNGIEDESSAIPRTVRLSLSSQPPGAEVTVDEFPLPGTTPIESAPVTARPSRVIRVTLEGYVAAEGEFDFTTDRNLSFALTPLSAGPQGALAVPDGDATVGDGAGEDTAAEDAAAGDGESGEAAGQAASEGPQVTLTITEDTWLEVYQGTSRNQGERLAFTTARPGQTLNFPLPVYVHVGNAGGVELAVDGQSRGAMGSSGEVRGLAVTQ
ncbi:MAG: RodZ domain-containing protein [Trueperaceae bacterium]